MEYMTEDNVVVHTGDLVYDYYSMEPVIIGEEDSMDYPFRTLANPNKKRWFSTIKPGSVTEDKPRGQRSSASMLNGERICTMEYAVRQGLKGAKQ